MKVNFISLLEMHAILRNRIERWTIIHQQKYLTSKLKEYNMLNCKSLSTPMQSGIRLSKEEPHSL